MEVWFPHDMDREFVKELIWEAGTETVKWIFVGTPSAGNVCLGGLEMGCNVIALCQDEHHKKHLEIAMVQKAAELTVKGNTLMFGSEALLLQAKQLKLNEPRKKPSKADPKADPVADDPKKKLRGAKAEKKKREKKVK